MSDHKAEPVAVTTLDDDDDDDAASTATTATTATATAAAAAAAVAAAATTAAPPSSSTTNNNHNPNQSSSNATANTAPNNDNVVVMSQALVHEIVCYQARRITELEKQVQIKRAKAERLFAVSAASVASVANAANAANAATANPFFAPANFPIIPPPHSASAVPSIPSLQTTALPTSSNPVPIPSTVSQPASSQPSSTPRRSRSSPTTPTISAPTASIPPVTSLAPIASVPILTTVPAVTPAASSPSPPATAIATPTPTAAAQPPAPASAKADAPTAQLATIKPPTKPSAKPSAKAATVPTIQPQPSVPSSTSKRPVSTNAVSAPANVQPRKPSASTKPPIPDTTTPVQPVPTPVTVSPPIQIPLAHSLPQAALAGPHLQPPHALHSADPAFAAAMAAAVHVPQTSLPMHMNPHFPFLFAHDPSLNLVPVIPRAPPSQIPHAQPVPNVPPINPPVTPSAPAQPGRSSEGGDRKPSRYWAPDEHQRFLTARALCGPKNYGQISDYVGTRNARQVRTHAQKYQKKLEREDAKRRTARTIEPPAAGSSVGAAAAAAVAAAAVAMGGTSSALPSAALLSPAANVSPGAGGLPQPLADGMREVSKSAPSSQGAPSRGTDGASSTSSALTDGRVANSLADGHESANASEAAAAAIAAEAAALGRRILPVGILPGIPAKVKAADGGNVPKAFGEKSAGDGLAEVKAGTSKPVGKALGGSKPEGSSSAAKDDGKWAVVTGAKSITSVGKASASNRAAGTAEAKSQASCLSNGVKTSVAAGKAGVPMGKRSGVVTKPGVLAKSGVVSGKSSTGVGKTSVTAKSGALVGKNGVTAKVSGGVGVKQGSGVTKKVVGNHGAKKVAVQIASSGVTKVQAGSQTTVGKKVSGVVKQHGKSTNSKTVSGAVRSAVSSGKNGTTNGVASALATSGAKVGSGSNATILKKAGVEANRTKRNLPTQDGNIADVGAGDTKKKCAKTTSPTNGKNEGLKNGPSRHVSNLGGGKIVSVTTNGNSVNRKNGTGGVGSGVTSTAKGIVKRSKDNPTGASSTRKVVASHAVKPKNESNDARKKKDIAGNGAADNLVGNKSTCAGSGLLGSKPLKSANETVVKQKAGDAVVPLESLDSEEADDCEGEVGLVELTTEGGEVEAQNSNAGEIVITIDTRDMDIADIGDMEKVGANGGIIEDVEDGLEEAKGKVHDSGRSIENENGKRALPQDRGDDGHVEHDEEASLKRRKVELDDLKESIAVE